MLHVLSDAWICDQDERPVVTVLNLTGTPGRILIVKALVISLAYYLLTVNGIPRKTLATMAWERAILPVDSGGIGAPSVKLRYEAIKIGWLS